MLPSSSSTPSRILTGTLALLAAVGCILFFISEEGTISAIQSISETFQRVSESRSTDQDLSQSRVDDVGALNDTSRQSKSSPTENNRAGKYDICVVGAGLSGAVIAERCARERNMTVFIMDSRHHIGGNCYDFIDAKTRIRVNLYGAHLFHTNNKRVWDYLAQYSAKAPWVRWDHQVKAWVDGHLVPIPVNIDTVNTLFNDSIANSDEMDKWLQSVQQPCAASSTPQDDDLPTSAGNLDGCQTAEEMAKHRVGVGLYEKIFRPYTQKQWGVNPSKLHASVTARIPVRNTFDPRYFSDRYQALPLHGYTHFFETILDHPLITTQTGADYFDWRRRSLLPECGKLVFTGPIDKYFSNAGLEKLEYRSIRFTARRVYNIGDGAYAQPNSVVNYPSRSVPFTRIIEYKHFLHQSSKHTITVSETSSDSGDPYYPVPNDRNKALFRRYQLLAAEEEKKGVHFVGRLANYKYFNMDEAIANALAWFDRAFTPATGAAAGSRKHSSKPP